MPTALTAETGPARADPWRLPMPAACRSAWIAAWTAAWLCAGTLPAAAAAPDADASKAGIAARSLALQRASQAVLGVQALALDDARSNATLGRSRSGSGVLIGADGLVLTIGYLVLEAEQVQLVRDDGRSVPARVLGYDVATGLGLLQALAPLGLEPAPIARALPLPRTPESPAALPVLTIASGGEEAAVSSASLVARRAFSGFWEYHIEGALFTAPPRRDHSGAGLFNPAGELLGIGSLLLADVHRGDGSGAGTDPAPRQGGNMFVPVDLLLPVLDELRQRGRTAASQRAWLGLNCVEQDGGLRVVRVSDDSPADVAGLQVGDRILRIDGTEVHALAALWQALWAGGASEREVTLEIERDALPRTLKVHSVDRMLTLRRATGI